jgi:hypothetical protein
MAHAREKRIPQNLQPRGLAALRLSSAVFKSARFPSLKRNLESLQRFLHFLNLSPHKLVLAWLCSPSV